MVDITTDGNASPVLNEVNTCANLKACYDAGVVAEGDTVKVGAYISTMFLKPINFAKYGSVSVWLTDEEGGEAKEFELYNCYSYNGDTLVYFGPDFNLDGNSSIDVDTVVDGNGVMFVVGSYVEAVGAIKLYNTTYELNTGCYFTAGGIKEDDEVYYIKHPFDGQNWEWKEMTYTAENEDGMESWILHDTWGGVGFNISIDANDDNATWFAAEQIDFADLNGEPVDQEPAIGQEVTFSYIPFLDEAGVLFEPMSEGLINPSISDSVSKVLHNGQLIIIREGKNYNTLGTEL